MENLVAPDKSALSKPDSLAETSLAERTLEADGSTSTSPARLWGSSHNTRSSVALTTQPIEPEAIDRHDGFSYGSAMQSSNLDRDADMREGLHIAPYAHAAERLSQVERLKYF